jgi:hypothetical protein
MATGKTLTTADPVTARENLTATDVTAILLPAPQTRARRKFTSAHTSATAAVTIQKIKNNSAVLALSTKREGGIDEERGNDG